MSERGIWEKRGHGGNPNSLANLIPGGPARSGSAKGIGTPTKDVRAKARDAYMERLDRILEIIDNPLSKNQDVIKAFEMLHRLSGDHVQKIATTDAEGNDTSPVHDEEALTAILKAKAAALKN